MANNRFSGSSTVSQRGRCGAEEKILTSYRIVPYQETMLEPSKENEMVMVYNEEEMYKFGMMDAEGTFVK